MEQTKRIQLDGSHALLCPTCSFEYTHMMTCESTTNDDGRPNHTIFGFCESGHTFGIEFAQHEGQTFTSIVECPPEKSHGWGMPRNDRE